MVLLRRPRPIDTICGTPGDLCRRVRQTDGTGALLELVVTDIFKGVEWLRRRSRMRDQVVFDPNAHDRAFSSS